MPRRNHAGGTAQLPKPKGGRVRKSTFWHALAAGIMTQEEQVTR